MIIRSKAPLRLGLAGGGSDVSPYCDIYNGAILNVTINLFAYCTIETTNDGKISMDAIDMNQTFSTDANGNKIEIDGTLDLIKGTYNKILDIYGKAIPPCKITTFSDAPAGSGLGSSSTMVVAILKAFVEWLNLPLGEYDIASIAYVIERVDLKQAGGKQDQYAATFGGFNFMEFGKNNSVIVNPLRIKRWILDELEASLLLYYTGISRFSSSIIDEQIKNTQQNNSQAVSAMHKIKQSAFDMKTALLKGDIQDVGKILGSAWEEKKKMANSITNKDIQNVMEIAMNAGATSGKISGAGGGGVIIFFVPPTKKYHLKNVLSKQEGSIINFNFTSSGTHGWKILD